MTDRELMQQALEAKQTSLIELLEAVPVDARLVVDDGPHSTSFYPVGRMCHGAAAALRERLAQPEQEPVAWCIVENGRVHGLVKSKPAVMNAEKWQPLYTAPPPRKPLTYPQIHELDWPEDVSFEDILLFVRAIEAKLKEKNT